MGMKVDTPVEARVAAKQNDVHSWLDRVRDTVESAVWIFGAIGVVLYGDGHKDLVHILMHDERIGGVSLSVAIVSFTLNVVIFLYLAFFLPRVRGEKRPWEEAAPWAIPLGTLCGIITFVFLNLALLPVYHWFTPLVTVVLFLGFMLVLCYIPPLTKDEKLD